MLYSIQTTSALHISGERIMHLKTLLTSLFYTLTLLWLLIGCSSKEIETKTIHVQSMQEVRYTTSIEAELYHWKQLSGIKVTLLDADTSTLHFIAPKVEKEEKLLFILEAQTAFNTQREKIEVIVVPKRSEENNDTDITIGGSEDNTSKGKGDDNTTTDTDDTQSDDEIPISLTLSAERYLVERKGTYREHKKRFVYGPKSVKLFLKACFKDGHCDMVTGEAKFDNSNRHGARISRSSEKIVLYHEGNYTIKAHYKGVESNSVTIRMQDIRKSGKLLYANVLLREKKATPRRGSEVVFYLLKKPTDKVILPLRLDANASVRFKETNSLEYNLTFTANEISWYDPNFVTIVDLKHDSNDTTTYTLHTGNLISSDPAYNGVDPEDVTIHPTEAFTIFPPTLKERKGAIRGVRIAMRIVATQLDLEFTLAEKPKGMHFERCHMHTEMNLAGYEGKSCRLLVWDIPMDIEENRRYKVTIEATNPDKHKERTTFYIKVPKTFPIQTKLVNNELIVTDKRSPLYGMKLKGHNKEDVSKVRLRGVRYEDVWKAKGKGVHTVFVIYNKPPKLDIDLPGDLKNGLYRFAGSWSLFSSGEAWKSIAPSYLIDAKDAWDEKTGRYVIPKNAKKILQRNEYDNGGNRIYLLYGEKK